MDDIKNTILKTNSTNKLKTTQVKFANLLKVDRSRVFVILNTLEKQKFLTYGTKDDELHITILNPEGIIYKRQEVKQINKIICVSCGHRTRTHFNSQVINGIKYKRATCYCANRRGPIFEKLECAKYIKGGG
jgi:hypothetical protein